MKGPVDANITLPEVMLKGYILERIASIPGKKSTSAVINIPKKLAGNYLVILIPKAESGEILDSVEM